MSKSSIFYRNHHCQVKNYAQAAMQEQPEHPLLFINQKSCGQLFTCETLGEDPLPSSPG
jgi:hypothetical protein